MAMNNILDRLLRNYLMKELNEKNFLLQQKLLFFKDNQLLINYKNL